MPTEAMASSQLRTIGWLHSYFAKQSIVYWLFGGWAVDFHAGRVTRHHEGVTLRSGSPISLASGQISRRTGGPLPRTAD
jgi:hypothetical protein